MGQKNNAGCNRPKRIGGTGFLEVAARCDTRSLGAIYAVYAVAQSVKGARHAGFYDPLLRVAHNLNRPDFTGRV